MVQVKDIVAVLEQFAPVCTQCDWDNSGLQVGHINNNVRRILLALDVTEDIIAEAVGKNADMIITHHPLLYNPLKSLSDATRAGALALQAAENGIAVYAVHTPLDAAIGGCNDVLCDMFDVRDVIGFDEMPIVGVYCARVGNIEPIDIKDLAKKAAQKLNCTPLIGGTGIVRRLAICSGSGGSLYAECAAVGADCLLTGEIKHSDALELRYRNIKFLQCGHYNTEYPAMIKLNEYLQNRFSVLKYDVESFCTELCGDPYT